MKPDTPNCHLCGAPGLDPVPGIEDFVAISSDIRIVAGTLQLTVCQACGTVQKLISADWSSAVGALYADYTINHQAGGGDPYIFDSQYGPGPRADILVTHLLRRIPLDARGRLLDIGCGNGNILRSFGNACTAWDLFGLDRAPHSRHAVLELPGVKGFYADLDELRGDPVDIVVMSHVLEHIPHPVEFLGTLRQRLADNGLLYIAVPDIRQNPVDLFVLDHCTHFDVASLHSTLVHAGYDPVEIRADVLGKEIIAIVRNQPATASQEIVAFAVTPAAMATRYLALCSTLRQQARQMRSHYSSFGIMGTGTAAVWLFGELGQSIEFFVDEDEQRIGRTTLGKSVLAPAQIPAGAGVFIPMSTRTAQAIIARAACADVDFAYAAENNIDDVALKIT